jgi:4-amino-4-deoxy-L-arabinose transferase-like glycosyltransferase
MLAAYAGAALATLAKGLVAVAIPGAALVLYTLVTRDTGPWRRLHALPGLVVYLVVAAPWFVLVSRANPEFAQFFFIHEHFERFLTETHNRTGEWWYFVQWFVLGIMPWILVWVVTLPRSWRDADAFANGFSWKRFCLVYAAFIFVFFSMSGSKLPSYILPMFPALALALGFELTRLSARTLMWIASPLALGGLAALVAYAVAWNDMVPQLASEQTPATIFRAFGPWVFAAVAAYTAGGIAAFMFFRNGSSAAKTLGVVALSLASLVGMQTAFVGHDAFALVRSAAPILREAERANGGPLDPRYPRVPGGELRPDPAVLSRSRDIARRVPRRDVARPRRGAGKGIQPGPLVRRVVQRAPGLCAHDARHRGRSRARERALPRAGGGSTACFHCPPMREGPT